MSKSDHLVDPEIRPVLEMLPAFDFTADMLAPIRTMMGLPTDPALLPQGLPVTVSDVTISGAAGDPDVRVMLFQPDSAPAIRPAYLHIHGGGYVIGNAGMNQAENMVRAADWGVTVVSVDYRLAPETAHPGPVEDCYAALLWLHRNAAELGVDPARIAIGGESAGGGLAAALALLARDRGEVPIIFQRLIYPMLDDRTCTTSDPNPFTGEFTWTPASNHFGWASLLGHEPGGQGVSAYAAPARAESLEGLPPTFIAVGALDLFLDENLAYAQRLMRSGVPCELHVYPGAFHAFQMAVEARTAKQAKIDDDRALNRALKG